MNNKFYVISFEMIDQCSKRWKQTFDVISTIQGEKLSENRSYSSFYR